MKCPNCGAELLLDPGRKLLHCEYCESVWDPDVLTGQSGAGDPAGPTGAEVTEPAGAEPTEPAGAEPTESAAAEPAPGTEEPDGSEETAAGPVPGAHDEAEEIRADGEYYEADVYLCRSCGAELLVTEDTAVTFCSYCGSQNILKSRVKSMPKPDFIIPFSRTREECEEAYRKALRRAGFAPSDMTKDTTVEKFRGIYMPYWVYDLESGGLVATDGARRTRHGDYIVTDHFRLESRGEASYTGISFDASSAFSDNLSQCIAPYDLSASREFDPVYLSGYYEDMADVPVSVYRRDAQQVGSAHVARSLYQEQEYSRYGVSEQDIQKQVHMRVTSEKMGLFPVWFLGCRSRDGRRISYAVVNGQTGKAAVDLPMDFGKYLLGSLVLAVPLFLLLNLFLVLTPTKALIGACLLAAVSLLINSSQLNEIYTRENRLDDKGVRRGDRGGEKAPKLSREVKETKGAGDVLRQAVQAFGGLWKTLLFLAAVVIIDSDGLSDGMIGIALLALVVLIVLSILSSKWTPRAKKDNGKKYRMPVEEKLKHLIPQLLSMGLAVIVLVLDPAADLWYYGAAVVSMLCVLAGFYDLVKGHNRLTTRVLPQMRGRGGDEYEMQ